MHTSVHLTCESIQVLKSEMLFSGDCASTPPGSTAEGIQKKSNKSQYLYRQLCRIDRELSQLGPSVFPTLHSYNQAQLQVQGMKGSLEDQLFKSNCVSPDDLSQKKYGSDSLVDLHVLVRYLQTEHNYFYLLEYTGALRVTG